MSFVLQQQVHKVEGREGGKNPLIRARERKLRFLSCFITIPRFSFRHYFPLSKLRMQVNEFSFRFLLSFIPRILRESRE